MKITNEVGRGVRTLRDQVKVINEANRQIMDQLDARIKHLEKTFANEMEELEAVWSSVLVGVLCFFFHYGNTCPIQMLSLSLFTCIPTTHFCLLLFPLFRILSFSSLCYLHTAHTRVDRGDGVFGCLRTQNIN
jgi:hypothetical protein